MVTFVVIQKASYRECVQRSSSLEEAAKWNFLITDEYCIPNTLDYETNTDDSSPCNWYGDLTCEGQG